MSSAKPAPSRRLILLILGITVAPLATLLWLGWRDVQQSQQRIERAADLVVGALQRAVAASEQRLAAGAADWPDGAAVLIVHEDSVDAAPKGRLAYFPRVLPLREAPEGVFAAGE